MKKPKFLIKVDSNKNAKVYLNKHWIKDITWLSLEADVSGYHIELTKYARNSKGRLIVEGNEVRQTGYACTIKRN